MMDKHSASLACRILNKDVYKAFIMQIGLFRGKSFHACITTKDEFDKFYTYFKIFCIKLLEIQPDAMLKVFCKARLKELDEESRRYEISPQCTLGIQTVLEEKGRANKRKTEEMSILPILGNATEGILKVYLPMIQKACLENNMFELERCLNRASLELNLVDDVPLDVEQSIGLVYENVIKYRTSAIDKNIIPMVLLEACKNNQTEVIILLAQAGFDIHKRFPYKDPKRACDSDTYSLLRYAKDNDNYELLGILVELGGDLNQNSRILSHDLLSTVYTYKWMFFLAALGARVGYLEGRGGY